MDVDRALSAARDAAGWAVLGLGLSVVAAALGGMVGAKMTPAADEDDVHDAAFGVSGTSAR